ATLVPIPICSSTREKFSGDRVFTNTWNKAGLKTGVIDRKHADQTDDALRGIEEGRRTGRLEISAGSSVHDVCGVQIPNRLEDAGFTAVLRVIVRRGHHPNAHGLEIRQQGPWLPALDGLFECVVIDDGAFHVGKPNIGVPEMFDEALEIWFGKLRE